MPRVVAGKSGQKPSKKRAMAHRAAKAALKGLRPKGARSSVLEEKLFRPDGHRGRVLTLDANSPTFATDLTLVFEKNVARARREHKKKSHRAGQRA